MKNLETTWFLNSPIDAEHKQYILLDFLQELNTEIRRDNIYQPIQQIFSSIKDLKLAEKILTGEKIDHQILDPQEIQIFEKFASSKFSENEKKELSEIVDLSLDCLYKYAELGTNIWKKLEKRISVYNLRPEIKNSDLGILMVRNLATDEIYSYWWSRYSNSTSFGIMMKKVKIPNNFFSISYDHLVNEILVSVGVECQNTKITVIEIYEDFNEESNILKIAKELFIKDLESQVALL
jgi:hypothetical protein